jgi:anti-repressor protein
MKDLIQVNYNSDIPTVSGRALHEFLEVKTEYKDWFPRMLEFGFIEGVDFSSFLSESTGGRPSINHNLTIPMAKEIAMLQRNDKGKQIRQYFIDIENKWNSPELTMARALKMADSRIKQLAHKVEELEPKAEFHDRCLSAEGLFSISEAAKILFNEKIGSKKLFEILRKENILMSDNVPYQEYINRGFFKVKINSINIGNDKFINKPQTFVTSAGIKFLADRFSKGKEPVKMPMIPVFGTLGMN